MEFLKQNKKDYYYILTIDSVRHLIVYRSFYCDYFFYNGSKAQWMWVGYELNPDIPEYANESISCIDNLTLHVINTQKMIESVLEDE